MGYARKAPRLAAAIALSLLLAMLVGCAGSGERDKLAVGSDVLVHFDRADYDRANVFVSRFGERKGDILYAVVPTIDSGPIIYDLHSDGRTVIVRVDDTRDVYGSGQSRTMHTCEGVGWTGGGDGTKLTLSGCDGIEGDWRPFGFDK